LVKDSFGSFIKKVAAHSYEATNLDSSTPATINISLQVTIYEALAVDFFRQVYVILVSTVVISVYFMLYS
jgi:hypothetical protein